MALRMIALDELQPPLTLANEDIPAYQRRFSTLFVDDARTRAGGLGRVVYAENPYGERIALKVLEPDPVWADATDDERAALEELRAASFKREYESQRALSGIAGFPVLYGQAKLDGDPAIIMEWIEGETLEKARAQLAIDDDGRLSPVTAAAIGTALFELLSHMELLDGGIVHRDVSPSNVMICTERASIAEQARTGSFDLRLVDFGSAVLPNRASSMTERHGAPRGATPDYAPPEMLTDDIPYVSDLRKSPAVDVYAAASVVYALVNGHAPYDLARSKDGSDASGVEGKSFYLQKQQELPLPSTGAHDALGDTRAQLAQEDQLRALIESELAGMQPAPSDYQLSRALSQVDQQLSHAILMALEPSQKLRPTASMMRDALASFIELYPRNLANALAGKPLERKHVAGMERGEAAQAASRQRSRKLTGKTLAGVILGAVALACGILCGGVGATLSIGSAMIALNMPIVIIALLLPTAVAYLARWRDVKGRAGFLRASVVLAAFTGLELLAILLAAIAPESVKPLLAWAVVVCNAAAWCGLVLDRKL